MEKRYNKSQRKSKNRLEVKRMQKVSDVIELFLKDLLGESNEHIEIQRNELANFFSCAPSQINYVLTTRFSIDKGYLVESKRGGGGSIKIVKIALDSKVITQNLIREIGESITKQKAAHILEVMIERKMISERERVLIGAAISDRSILSPISLKNQLRANILKNIILALETTTKK